MIAQAKNVAPLVIDEGTIFNVGNNDLVGMEGKPEGATFIDTMRAVAPNFTTRLKGVAQFLRQRKERRLKTSAEVSALGKEGGVNYLIALTQATLTAEKGVGIGRMEVMLELALGSEMKRTASMISLMDIGDVELV